VSIKESIVNFSRGIKNYFIPPAVYEHADITQDSFLVVHKVDHGIVKHLKLIWRFIKAVILSIWDLLVSLIPKRAKKQVLNDKIQFDFKKRRDNDDDEWSEHTVRNMLWKKHQDKTRETFWKKKN
jgi:hypothetical protein